jgi:hypothetical protein
VAEQKGGKTISRPSQSRFGGVAALGQKYLITIWDFDQSWKLSCSYSKTMVVLCNIRN